jgi:hypothetical protein
MIRFEPDGRNCDNTGPGQDNAGLELYDIPSVS